MDIQRQFVSKVFVGNVDLSLGAFSPGANAPHGRLYGLSLRRGISLLGLDLVPEFSWTHLNNGDDLGVNKRNNVRVGVTALVPISL
jgi:hypothetical protein